MRKHSRIAKIKQGEKMISLLRQPDMVCGATEKTPFRFEESFINDVKYSYDVTEKSAKITVYPSGAPV